MPLLISCGSNLPAWSKVPLEISKANARSHLGDFMTQALPLANKYSEIIPKVSINFYVVLLASRRRWCRIGARIIENNRRNFLLADKLIEVGEVGLHQLVPFRDLLIASLFEHVEDLVGLLRRRCVGCGN